MGTISKGILGGFSGKVGSVVGGTWKGIDYMRSKPAKRKFIPSQPQLEQQTKFTLSVRFVQGMSGMVEVGYRNFAIKKSGANAAMAYVSRNAVTGIYPDFSISYPNVLVSRGELPNAQGPAVISAPGSLATFSWTNNSGMGNARTTDLVMMIAYCPAFNQSIFTTTGAQRSAITDSLNLTNFTGQTVETYVGFISENGKNISNSFYTGSIIVT